jgi:hypothetical protein
MLICDGRTLSQANYAIMIVCQNVTFQGESQVSTQKVYMTDRYRNYEVYVHLVRQYSD